MPAAAGMYYSVQGDEKPGQPSVILIHGAGLNHQMWPAELRRLPGWRVLALDLPGHGQSPGSGSQSIPGFADRLLEFLDALGIDQAVLVGHGMGGAAALSFAHAHPGRAAALGLVATAARLHIPLQLQEMLAVQTGMPAAANAFLELMTAPDLEPYQSARLQRLLKGTRLGVLKDDLLACSSFHLSLARSWFSQPAFVLTGSEDSLIPMADVRHLVRHIPDCSLHVWQGAGHMPMLYRPIEAAALVETFLTKKLSAFLS